MLLVVASAQADDARSGPLPSLALLYDMADASRVQIRPAGTQQSPEDRAAATSALAKLGLFAILIAVLPISTYFLTLGRVFDGVLARFLGCKVGLRSSNSERHDERSDIGCCHGQRRSHRLPHRRLYRRLFDAGQKGKGLVTRWLDSRCAPLPRSSSFAVAQPFATSLHTL